MSHTKSKDFMKQIILVMVLATLSSCADINGDLFGELLEEPLQHARHFVFSTLSTANYTDEDNKELYPYVDMFVSDAAKYGIDLSYVYDGRIVLKFADKVTSARLPRGTGGTAYSLNDDQSIIIYIWKKGWDQGHDFYKKMLMYHELGHDVLRFDHMGDGIMSTKTYLLPEENEEELIKELFNSY